METGLRYESSLLLVNAVLSSIDVTACLDSRTVLNSVSF